MSALSNLEMSSFGLKLGKLSGLPKLEEKQNEKRIIDNEPIRNRTYQYH